MVRTEGAFINYVKQLGAGGEVLLCHFTAGARIPNMFGSSSISYGNSVTYERRNKSRKVLDKLDERIMSGV